MLDALQDDFSQCQACIVYIPQNNEVNFYDSNFPIKISEHKIEIPYDKNSYPNEWAEMCIKSVEQKIVCILIPGVQFDMHGTRQGSGGGWYDRFLSAVPREWIRIGVAHSSQVSTSPIRREVWDEPTDWLVVYDGLSWKTYKM